MNQSVVQNLDYLPFGELNSSDSGVTNLKFTGLERDSETNLHHASFRQYSSQLGRWMHPDRAGLAAVDITNPQSWDRYSYVLNNPLALVDPSGLDDCVDAHEDCSGTFFEKGAAGVDIEGAEVIDITPIDCCADIDSIIDGVLDDAFANFPGHRGDVRVQQRRAQPIPARYHQHV